MQEWKMREWKHWHPSAFPHFQPMQNCADVSTSAFSVPQ